MILGKIMMIESSSKRGSIEYQISKHALMLGPKIKDYTLNDFLKETGISKTSLMRFLANIGINSFTYFKEIITVESLKGITTMQAIKNQYKLEDFNDNIKKLGKIIKEAKRVIIIGDGNCFGLMVYKKAFVHLGIDMEIPIYLGKEEDLFLEYNLDSDDLVIFISLHETFQSFFDHRVMFYKDIKYYRFNYACKIAFIGEVDLNNEKIADYEFIIDNEKEIYERKEELDKLFEDTLKYLCLDYNY